MKFEYQAIDDEGSIVRGIIIANDAQKVLQILLHKQLHPIDIRPLTESTVELSRLNQLKRRLEGKEESKEGKMEKPNLETEVSKKAKFKFDWTYFVFILLMMIMIIISAINL